MADPTPAEIEAGAAELERHLSVAMTWGEIKDATAAVLRAVLPDRDTRLREAIAQDLLGTIYAGVKLPDDLRPTAGRPNAAAIGEWAARIARAHTTGGTDERP